MSNVQDAWQGDVELVGIAVDTFPKVVELLGLQAGMTGLDVQAEVKSFTQTSKLSALRHIQVAGGSLFEQVNEGIRLPTVFLSHCWQFTIQDIMQSLSSLNSDEVVWFDLFSVQQHADVAIPFEWYQHTFFKNIERVGKVVMVMTSRCFPQPITLSRLWCIVELYGCIKTGSSFDVSMSSEVQETFLRSIKEDHRTFYRSICHVQTRECKAEQHVDMENIGKVIETAGGFAKMDQMVAGKLKEWFVRVLKEQVEGSVDVEKAAYMHTLGVVYEQEGKHGEAAAQLQQAWDVRKETLGEEHRDTLWSMSWLGWTYMHWGKNKKAQELLEQCFQKQKEAVGVDDERTLHTMGTLGGLYGGCLQRFQEGENVLEDCLKRARARLGAGHDVTLHTMNSLAVTYHQLGREEDAEKLYLECLELRKEVRGDSHPETLQTMSNLSVLYNKQGEHAKAEEMHVECLRRRREIQGEDHFETLTTMFNLGMAYEGQDTLPKLDEAVDVLEDCVKRMRDTNHQLLRLAESRLKQVRSKRNFMEGGGRCGCLGFRRRRAKVQASER